jgi:WD repeat-containing protein 7
VAVSIQENAGLVLKSLSLGLTIFTRSPFSDRFEILSQFESSTVISWFVPYTCPRSMNSVPLVLPFTLATSNSGLEGPAHVSPCVHVLVEEASSIADVSCLAYWIRPGLTSPTAQHFSSSDALEAVVLGCEDGTLYLLRQSHHHTPALINVEKPLLSRPPSPATVPLSNRSRSRPRTPTTSLAPFSFTSRARVVSGISGEQAQAPKNFVDFEEEPEKLKELLKGGVRDSASTERAPLSYERAASTERQPGHYKGRSSPSGSVRRSRVRSLLSATQSPALSITSLPSPASPSALPSPFRPSYHLSLESHIIPARSGSGNAVVGLHVLVNGRHVVCLQSQGYDITLLFFLH